MDEPQITVIKKIELEEHDKLIKEILEFSRKEFPEQKFSLSELCLKLANTQEEYNTLVKGSTATIMFMTGAFGKGSE